MSFAFSSCCSFKASCTVLISITDSLNPDIKIIDRRWDDCTDLEYSHPSSHCHERNLIAIAERHGIDLNGPLIWLPMAIRCPPTGVPLPRLIERCIQMIADIIAESDFLETEIRLSLMAIRRNSTSVVSPGPRK